MFMFKPNARFFIALAILFVLIWIVPVFAGTDDNGGIVIPPLSESLVMLFTALLPVIIQYAKKIIPNKNGRFVLSIVLSGITGVVFALVMKIHFSWENIILVLSGVFAYSQYAYSKWKQLQLIG